MTSRPLDSIPALLECERDYGFYPMGRNMRFTPAATASTDASGKINISCLDRDFVVPPIDAALQGYVIGSFSAGVISTHHLLLVKKVLLAYLTFSGGAGTYTNVGAMPSRYHYGDSSATQVIPDFPVIRCATVVTGATTPTITVGYTDAINGAGRSLSYVSPSNPAAGSGFALNPLLQGTDRGMISVQSMSTSGGSSGVLEVWGCRILAYEMGYTSNGGTHTQVFQTAAQSQPVLEPGDLLTCLRLNSVASTAMFAHWDLVPVTP